MNKKANRQLKVALLGFIYAMMPGPVLADDTEIFFGGAQRGTESVPPNILFMLDTSGSMNQEDNTGISRLDRMKAALRTLLGRDNDQNLILEDVNVGLGRYTVPGGAILYPVKPIDEIITDGLTLQECDSFRPQNGPLTVRDVLRCLVEQMETKISTPIVGSMYEAALYLRGEAVNHGRIRGTEGLSEQGRVSHPESYIGGTVTVINDAAQRIDSEDCTYSNDTDDLDCGTEEITGTPTYESPITETCQETHLVMLSDGEPRFNNSEELVKTLVGKVGEECINHGINDSNFNCAWDLAEFLATVDQAPNVSDGEDGKALQTIKTHTIGFNFDNANDSVSDEAQNWFRAIAETYGGGKFREAESADQLATVFLDFFDDVEETNNSFVVPSVAVSQLNRLTNLNEIYFALFQPKSQPKWIGNLKRYKLGQEDPDDPNSIAILDNSTPPQVAVANTGTFDPIAKSFWSTSVDGNEVGLGGVASKITHIDRKIYTYTGDYSGDSEFDLSNAVNKLHETNTAITNAMLLGIPTPTASDTAPPYERDLTLQWARGINVNDPDYSATNLVNRPQIGDPLHSQPVLITYGSTDNNPDMTLFFGTNEGALHAINTNDGTEEFAFIPQELLPNLNPLRRNSSNVNHIYGLDGSITPWVKGGGIDDDGNLIAPTSVILFIGMRRGGKNYYALDVTNLGAPQLKWVIKGGPDGTSGFEELAQTWSKPVLTKIEHDGEEKTVLIFAGGYDTDQDTAEDRTEDTEGRAIFIVNAETGTKLWSGGSSDSSPAHNTIFPEMDYSIPSNMRVIDIDSDGKADQMYVGDMGGRIWRFDIRSHAQNAAAGALVTGGIIADLNGGTTAANNRRFYSAPDLAVIRDIDGTRFMSIAIGSGWRAHPLDEVVEDRFYMIKQTNNIFSAPDADEYPEGDEIITETGETRLFEATNNDIGEDDATEQDVAAAGNGWFIDLQHGGEKILASSITLDNLILFTSFQPGISASPCDAPLGKGRLYAINIVDATPADPFSENPDENDPRHFVEDLEPGIPPDPTVFFDDFGEPQVVVGKKFINDVPLKTVKKVYWRPVE